MKTIQRVLLSVLVSFSLLFAVGGWAATPSNASSVSPFKEGVHYKNLAQFAHPDPKSKQVKVIEFFSYGCPHCFAMQPHVRQWLKQKPATINFETIPAYWNPSFQLLAQAYYTLVLLKQEKLHDKIFTAIHAEGRPMNTPEDIENFLVAQGLDRAKVHNTFNSFSVQQKMKLADQTFRGYGLDGVPTFVVGGKYMTNIAMAGSPDKVFKVVEFLVQKVKNEKK